jgi:membrane protease YdiL (CAAX protease family)
VTDTALVKPGAQRAVIVQLLLVTVLVAWFIWFGRDAFAGSAAVFGSLLLLVLIWSHLKRGDSFGEIGFRIDTARRTALLFAPVAITVVTLTLAIGAWMESLRFPAPHVAIGTLVRLVLFGIAQQYVLLGFFYRGIDGLVRSSTSAILLTALIFAAFHIPNPFLMTVTFFAGAIAAAIYRRSPNLWVNGTMHGFISFVLYYSLPDTVTGGLRVGPGY